MARASIDAQRASGFNLTLLCTTAVIELIWVALVALGSEEVADALPFGRTGTAVIGVAGAVIACLGATVGWRGAGSPMRGVTAGLVFVVVGIIAMMLLFFVVAGGAAIVLAVLLAHAAFSVAMIGRAVLRSVPARAQG